MTPIAAGFLRWNAIPKRATQEPGLKPLSGNSFWHKNPDDASGRVRSVFRDHRARKPVVQANPYNAVRDARAKITGKRGRSAGCYNRGSKGPRNPSEIDIEKFKLGGPVAADRALDAAADGPSCVYVVCARRARNGRLGVNLTVPPMEPALYCEPCTAAGNT